MNALKLALGCAALTFAAAAAGQEKFRIGIISTMSGPGGTFGAETLAGLNLAINLVFATFYMLEPGSIANARPGSFSDAFFFSFETMATVGYGNMSPATLYGHGVATAEIPPGAHVHTHNVLSGRGRGDLAAAEPAVDAARLAEPPADKGAP